MEPVTPPLARSPIDVAPSHLVETDVHRTNLPITFLQDIPPPRPRDGTSSQWPSHDPHLSVAFPHMPQYTPSTHFTSSPLDEPLRWFPPYTMTISDPYHPSPFTELEITPRPLPYPCQPSFIPPHSSPSPFSHPPAPLTPFPEFDTRFVTIEQQISYLLRHVYQPEEELAHVRSLLFVTPPPHSPPLA
ncbi:hypothetical protein Hanom_Chr03g00227521 [Helianthus anomalus]